MEGGLSRCFGNYTSFYVLSEITIVLILHPIRALRHMIVLTGKLSDGPIPRLRAA